MRRTIPALTILAVLIGAPPVLAQYAGTWTGEGYGKCPHPYHSRDQVIYPWQAWEGLIPNAQNEFTGEWVDNDGNQGFFEGAVTYSNANSAEYRGVWGWIDTSVSPPYYKKLGKFYMNFRGASLTCKGEWWLMDGSANGWMKGEIIN